MKPAARMSRKCGRARQRLQGSWNRSGSVARMGMWGGSSTGMKLRALWPIYRWSGCWTGHRIAGCRCLKPGGHGSLPTQLPRQWAPGGVGGGCSGCAGAGFSGATRRKSCMTALARMVRQIRCPERTGTSHRIPDPKTQVMPLQAMLDLTQCARISSVERAACLSGRWSAVRSYRFVPHMIHVQATVSALTSSAKDLKNFAASFLAVL